MSPPHVRLASTLALVCASLVVTLVLALAPARAFAYVVLSSGSSCGSGTQVSVEWTFYDDPSSPIGLPQWVGYDVYRRSAAQCGSFVRVNDTIVPRVAVPIDTHSVADPGASPGVAYHYRIVPVDANRDPVVLPICDCFTDVWTNCPQASTTAIQGTIYDDWGWALAIMPCAGSCYTHVYFDDPGAVTTLRPFVGSGLTFNFYGSIGCGSVEGCAIDLAGYEQAACGSTPSHTTSWGELKAVYR